MTKLSAIHPANGVPKAPRLVDLVRELLLHPQQLILLWNWKSALLSVILRGPIFFTAALRQGWQAAMAALLTESIFCVLSAGFYGALVQIFKDAEPQWLTGGFLTVVMPITFQILEYLLHWFSGTPHLRGAVIVSFVVSAISALFNWYAMRRGTLLVGQEAGGFGADLRRLPRLFFGFFAVLPRKIAQKWQSWSSSQDGARPADSERRQPNR